MHARAVAAWAACCLFLVLPTTHPVYNVIVPAAALSALAAPARLRRTRGLVRRAARGLGGARGAPPRRGVADGGRRPGGAHGRRGAGPGGRVGAGGGSRSRRPDTARAAAPGARGPVPRVRPWSGVGGLG